jgi:hypothetical protein
MCDRCLSRIRVAFVYRTDAISTSLSSLFGGSGLATLCMRDTNGVFIDGVFPFDPFGHCGSSQRSKHARTYQFFATVQGSCFAPLGHAVTSRAVPGSTSGYGKSFGRRSGKGSICPRSGQDNIHPPLSSMSSTDKDKERPGVRLPDRAKALRPLPLAKTLVL